jgi:hypothetical protein
VSVLERCAAAGVLVPQFGISFRTLMFCWVCCSLCCYRPLRLVNPTVLVCVCVFVFPSLCVCARARSSDLNSRRLIRTKNIEITFRKESVF